MSIRDMTEPASTAAGGLALYKLGAFGFMAVLAAIVVMAMTPPKHYREWVVMLSTTVMGSIGGGSFLVQWFGWQAWADSHFGLMALAGVIFVCGLPAWVIVRAMFAYGEMRKEGMAFIDIIRDIKSAVWK